MPMLTNKMFCFEDLVKDNSNIPKSRNTPAIARQPYLKRSGERAEQSMLKGSTIKTRTFMWTSQSERIIKECVTPESVFPCFYTKLLVIEQIICVFSFFLVIK